MDQQNRAPQAIDCSAEDRALARRIAGAPTRAQGTLSSSGELIAYLSADNQHELALFVEHTDGRGSHPLATHQGSVSALQFDPSSTFLYYLRDDNRSGRKALWRVSLFGESPELVRRPSSSTIVNYRLLSDSRILLHEEDFASGKSTLGIAKGDSTQWLISVDGYLALSYGSSDDPAIFASRMIGPGHEIPFQIDLRTLKTTWLADPSVRAVQHVGAAPEGGFYTATDAEGGAHILQRMDASGRVLATYADPAGDVTDFRFHKAARTLAVLIDRGDSALLRLLDPLSLVPVSTAPLLESGDLRLRNIDEHGQLLLVEASGVVGPLDVLGVDLAAGTIRPLGIRHPLSLEVSARSFRTHIEAHDGLKIPLHGYLPDPPGARAPALVMLHGGPAASSRMSWDPFWPFYVQLGFAVIAPNIRGSTGFGKAYQDADRGPLRVNAFTDLATVNHWIRQQSWWDGKTIVIMGGSYGGYLTYVALTKQPDLWSAGISLVGPSSLVTLLQSTTGAARMALEDEFGSLENDIDLLRELSPLPNTAAIRAPLYIYQGENDPLVPRSESEQIVAALRARHVPVVYHVARNEGHSIEQLETRVEFLSDSACFLREHVLRSNAH